MYKLYQILKGLESQEKRPSKLITSSPSTVQISKSTTSHKIELEGIFIYQIHILLTLKIYLCKPKHYPLGFFHHWLMGKRNSSKVFKDSI